MYDLYLTYSEFRTGGEPVDPSDRWTDYTTEHIDFSPRAIYKDREDAQVFGHGLNKEEIFGDFERGDIGHLVVVRYSTGDTFSHTNGAWHILGFYKDSKEAVDAKDSVNEDRGGEYVYKPWTGYFESLQDVELHTLVVQ